MAKPELTEHIMATAGDNVPAEIEYRDKTGKVVGFWAYGYWHPDYEYQGENMMNKPELILVRGLPGSGKSTIAKSFESYVHIEADIFWGVDYNFDITKIKDAHCWCQEKTSNFLNLLTINNHGIVKGVIVSNTFTTVDELRPYFQIAKEYNIVPNVILCQSNFGSIHNVPEAVIDCMKYRFEYNIEELYKEFA